MMKEKASMLFGIEHEYFGADGGAGINAPQLTQVIQTIRTLMPTVLCQETVGGAPGVFTATGARCYADGPVLEGATPEVRTPKEALAHTRAIELLMLQALQKSGAGANPAASKPRLIRATTDYAGHFFGAHHNFGLSRHLAHELVPYLIPFLATRFYSCSGGIGPAGFQMYQKAPAIRCEAGPDARINRAIVDTKNESMAVGCLRTHLSLQDSVQSELGEYLTLASTGIVLQMLDDGAVVGPCMKLADPISALQILYSDLGWKTPLPLACGGEATGLEIQEHFLSAAELYVGKRNEPWMSEAVRTWRDCLNKLKRGPSALSRALDPYIKMAFYQRILHKHGFTVKEFSTWCGALWPLWSDFRKTKFPRRGIREFIRERLPSVRFSFLEERMKAGRLNWSQFPRAWETLNQMVLTDLTYHDIDPAYSLYWRLEKAGELESRVIDDNAVAKAMRCSPRDTRAYARGELVSKFHADPTARAAWNGFGAAGGSVQMPDAYSTEGKWVPKAPSPAKRA